MFDDGLAAFPDVAIFLVNRANCLTHLKEYGLAKADLDWAETKKLSVPVHAALLATRSRLLLLKGELDGALSAANEALSIHALPTVHCALAAALLRSGKPAEAKDQASKAIELDKYESEAYWLRAEALTALGETDRGAADRAVAQKYRYIPYL